VVTVPDCGGMLLDECTREIEEAGLEPVPDILDYPDADPDKRPDEVLRTAPAPATEVSEATR
jgi:beta-lactam-binding protein with PASTA domain